MRMTTFEQKICDTLINNAFLFFSEAFGRLLLKDPHGIGKMDNDLLTLTCAELQISLELAVRATIVKRAGIGKVLKKDQEGLSEEEIIEHYNNNTIKVEDFEKQKNFLKSNNLSRLTKEEFNEIERFQKYRNKIVHFTCEFSDEDLATLRDDILYYVVHVILVLLADNTTGETPSEYLQHKLGYDYYNRLKSYDPYIKAMERYSAKNANIVWTCVGCNHRTYTPDEDYCYCCGYESISGYRRVDCGSCGTKDSVIYDNLDIHNPGNHHTMTGFCMNCEEHTEVFECPVCGEAHDVLLNHSGQYCSEGHCIHLLV